MHQKRQIAVEQFSERLTAGNLDKYGLIGSIGYSVPDLSRLVPFTFRDVRMGALEKLKIVGEGADLENMVLAHESLKLRSELRIHMSSATKNATVVLGESLTLKGDLKLFSTDQVIILTGGVSEVGHSGHLAAQLWNVGALLFIGAGSTTNGSNYEIAGKNRCIIVGDDCMFANGIHLSTHDMHAVADLSTKEMINHPADLVIEPHVWLGRNVSVGKGVVIGLGSVVGTHALLLHDCPRFCIAGGVPAKVLRRESTWDRRASLRPATLDRVTSLAKDVPIFKFPD